TARYAADHPIENVTHAVAICSTIAKGRLVSIDSSEAADAPGFLAILHHGNAPPLFTPVNNFMSASKAGEIRVVFEDDKVHYSGQYLAVLVAETLQQAQYAASLVKIAYEPATPVVETEQAMHTVFDPAEFFGEKLAVKRGDAAAALSSAKVQHEAEYFTPTE